MNSLTAVHTQQTSSNSQHQTHS